MVRAIEGCRRLLVFPEGTFFRPPGLLSFHMGAFLTAAMTGVEVIPVALRGSRSILRPGTWLIRPGSVFVSIEAPLRPEGDDWNAAVKLRDASRRVILRNSGEPDAATS
jgi:1-acyl-sn-glycerol-3-phosphate acyltransferase